MKRISFNDYEAQHLYELALEHFCVYTEDCFLCQLVKRKLEKFLGPKEVAMTKRVIRKNPYCKGIPRKNPSKKV